MNTLTILNSWNTSVLFESIRCEQEKTVVCILKKKKLNIVQVDFKT